VIYLHSVKLSTGERVAAKMRRERSRRGEITALTFTNRTQAAKLAADIGGAVIQRGRPFYVQIPQTSTGGMLSQVDPIEETAEANNGNS